MEVGLLVDEQLMASIIVEMRRIMSGETTSINENLPKTSSFRAEPIFKRV